MGAHLSQNPLAGIAVMWGIDCVGAPLVGAHLSQNPLAGIEVMWGKPEALSSTDTTQGQNPLAGIEVMWRNNLGMAFVGTPDIASESPGGD